MIVVGGEALIDLVPDQESAAAGSLPPLRQARGGGPYNTAVALGRLGSPAAFCGRVSTDAYGETLLAGLRAADVDVSLVQRAPEYTTLAVTTLGADGSAGYSFYTEGTADRLFELPAALPAPAEALCVGSNVLALEPGASAYEALLRRESARGVCTMLDPNIRTGLIADPDAYRERFRGWLPDVALLKLSVEDAEWLAGGEPAEKAVADWLRSGPEAVVLTHGGDGLSVATRTAPPLFVAAPRVEVVDTIGAGDTVNAALLHHLGRRSALSRTALAALDAAGWRDLLGFAARCAAVTCTRAGAEPPYAAEVAA